MFLGFWVQKPKNTRKSPRKLMSFRFLFGLNFEDEGAIGNFSSLSWKFWLTFNFRLLVSNLQCHMRSYELHYFLLLDPPCFLVALVSDTLLSASAEGEAQAVLLAALPLLDIFIQKCKKTTLPNRLIIQILCISKPNLVHLGFIELWLPGKQMENSIRIVLG